MLRISKKADYAVFLLGAIARQGAFPGGSAPDSVVSAHEIARQANLNKSVVANLLKEFARRNLLESVRGLRGGYRLGKPPDEISLGEILEVVEGPFTLVDCIEREQADVAAGLLPLAKGKPAASTTAHDCSLISNVAMGGSARAGNRANAPAVTVRAGAAPELSRGAALC